MKYTKVLVIFCVLFFLIFGSDLTNAQIRNLQKSLKPMSITAKLRAQPPSYSGRCPTTIKFNGNITVSRATTVSYRFIRSDGRLTPVHQLKFPQQGSKPVQTSWTLKKNTQGFMYIKILRPIQLESAKANINVRCTMSVGLQQDNQISGPPPFGIKVELSYKPGYLEHIPIRAIIVPKHPNTEVVRRSLMGKTFSFFIGNKLVGKKSPMFPSTYFEVPQEKTPNLNLKPGGNYKVMVMTVHNGKIVSGSTMMEIRKGRVKIHELSSKSIFCIHGTNSYPRYWHLGETVKVAAKFTHENFENIPIKNATVYFCVFSRTLATATTDSQGKAEFTFVLKPKWTFFDNRQQPLPRRPYMQKQYNFYIPETDLYKQRRDGYIPDPVRWLRACPQGMRLVVEPGTGYTICAE